MERRGEEALLPSSFLLETWKVFRFPDIDFLAGAPLSWTKTKNQKTGKQKVWAKFALSLVKFLPELKKTSPFPGR